MLEKFLRLVGVLQNIEKLAQPAVLRPGGRVDFLLVVPVRGDAVLGDVVHFGGADLQFDALSFGAENARMQ